MIIIELIIATLSTLSSIPFSPISADLNNVTFLQGPGGLTDYIDAEYIPDFLGGPCEVFEHFL